MKTISALIMFVFISVSGIAQTTVQKYATAIEYNDYIVDQQTAVGLAITEFTDKFNDSTSSKEVCNQQRLISLEKVKVCRNNIKAMPAWNGDVSLRDTALLLFDFYVRIFETSYSQILDLVFTEPFTDENQIALDKILEDLSWEEQKYDYWFMNCQKRFASKNRFFLSGEEDEGY